MDLPVELVTGHREVDEHHARMLAELDRLHIAGPDEAMDLVAFLRGHMSQHFAYEEQLMLDVGYPEYEAHRQEHLQFFDQFVLLKARLEREGASPKNVGRLVDAIEKWLAGHVLLQDRRLAEFVKAKSAM